MNIWFLLCSENGQEGSCERGLVEADPDTEGEGAPTQVDGVGQGRIAILASQVKVQVIIGIQIWKDKSIMSRYVDSKFSFFSFLGQQLADIYKQISSTIDGFSCQCTLTVKTFFVSSTKYISLFNHRTKSYYYLVPYQ